MATQKKVGRAADRVGLTEGSKRWSWLAGVEEDYMRIFCEGGINACPLIGLKGGGSVIRR